ncbi:hypothetical protein PPACK8108_LOCUS6485 [Phakopsora pachyrhizi]|uniref:Uncharacterized protein n=1 Tax=Phakopsora pachyrhizi TaxID=170000 RepID=A0AAV0ARE6_PHAPC|nr:hypothetical protein PPACK8108_LOCUS6485 [Phakopsora pachyrhizi]
MQEQHPQPYSYQNPELGLFIWEPGPSQSYYSRLPTKPKFQNMHSQPPIIDSNLLHHWPVGYQATENLITPLQNYPGVVGLNNHVGNGNQIYGPSEIIEPIILQIDAQLPRENPSGTHSASDLSYSTHSEEEGDPTWTSYEDSESSALSSSIDAQLPRETHQALIAPAILVILLTVKKREILLGQAMKIRVFCIVFLGIFTAFIKFF